MNSRVSVKNFAIVAGFVMAAGCLTAQAGIAERVSRSKVAGIDLLTYPMGVPEVVTVVGSLPAGNYFARRDGGNPTIAMLTTKLLDKGTTTQDRFALAKQLEDVGASLQFSTDTQEVSIYGRALKKDVPRLIHILAEELRRPAFTADEFEKARKQLAGELQQNRDSVGARAWEAFLRRAFPPGHPNYPASSEELLSALDKATVDEVRSFYQQYYGPAQLSLVFVGDVDRKAIQSEVNRSFSGWKGGVEAVRLAPAFQPAGAETLDIEIPDKASVTVIYGKPTGLRYTDPDALALHAGAAILGSGFTGRLMTAVREKEGLTYGIAAGVTQDQFVDGVLMINATFAPALLEKGIASTRREVLLWQTDGVTAEELADRKTNLIGSYQTSLATTVGMAQTIRWILEEGKPVAWLDDYPRAIDALTLQQVNAAIRKYADPQQMTLVKAGSIAVTEAKTGVAGSGGRPSDH